ncbi:MAG: D-glycero-beta-D-manno-heptose 1-phosphate adenylyltransferase [Bacteroidota bacterium]
MEFFNKKHELADLRRLINGWKLKNDVIVFTNGCFDILHPGHVAYLSEAKKLGHRLVVGLNTDASVRRLQKAPSRPYNDENIRMSMMAALHCVDAVILFDEDTPLELIKTLEPNILVKGGDYHVDEIDPTAKDYIVGSAEVRANGGSVVSVPLLEGFSTTMLVEKIKNS